MTLQLGGGDSDLARYADEHSLVLCVYPALGTATADEHDKTRAAEWAQKATELTRLGHRLIAISGDRLAEQRQWQADATTPRLIVLNDPAFEMARILGLRTMRRSGRRVYEPVTLIVERRRIIRAFPGSAEVSEIWTWLSARGRI